MHKHSPLLVSSRPNDAYLFSERYYFKPSRMGQFYGFSNRIRGQSSRITMHDSLPPNSRKPGMNVDLFRMVGSPTRLFKGRFVNGDIYDYKLSLYTFIKFNSARCVVFHNTSDSLNLQRGEKLCVMVRKTDTIFVH